jgi:hypothetical protein
MPFHVFLSQSLSLVTGGLDAWKVAKDIVLFLLTLVAVWLVWRQGHFKGAFKKLTLLAAGYGLLHLAVWALHTHIYQKTALAGIAYNNRLLWFVLLCLSAVLLAPRKLDEKKLIRLTIIVSTIVCALGILQYFLPKDLLTHVGYSVARGVKPAFFIDDKTDFPRIMSTLRDPNSLGAFILVPLCLLYGLFMRFRRDAVRRNKIILLAAIHIVALFLTFSRGAWAGAIVALVTCIAVVNGSIRLGRRTVITGAGIILVLAGLGFALRDQRTFQNVIQHSDETTVAPQDSNALHLDFAADSFKESVKDPVGHGPGTAGIVSIRNPDGGQLTENYYLQLLYEVGFVGLGVFIYVLLYVTRAVRAVRSLLGQALFAAMIAYAFMAMLMHLWSNEAVAAQWWLLAGACLGLVPLRNTRRAGVDKQRVDLPAR